MVVSAMGHNTDILVDLAHEITDHPPAREMDMLLSTGEQVSVALMAMAIESLAARRSALLAPRSAYAPTAPIPRRESIRFRPTACAKRSTPARSSSRPAFKVSTRMEILRRSAAAAAIRTAVALAAVLAADSCEIYTDVDGVYTTDPRQLPEARRMRQVSYDEMLELASLGAGVMHSRSIEFAKKFSVPIHVRSSFSDQPGSMITERPEAAGQAVSGASLVKNEARVTLLGVPDKPGTSLSLFSKIAAKNITVDMIVQNVGAEAKADISFTVPKDELPTTLKAVEAVATELGAEGFSQDDSVSKISVVGVGMATQTGVAQRMFRALADAQVNILMITTSEIKISALVSRIRPPRRCGHCTAPLN